MKNKELIYIPLWYLLIAVGYTVLSTFFRYLHSTMVSINLSATLPPLPPFLDLHSTMVSINQRRQSMRSTWQSYLHSTMVSINHVYTRVSGRIRENLHSTMVSINPICKSYCHPRIFIYIPLWYLLIKTD